MGVVKDGAAVHSKRIDVPPGGVRLCKRVLTVTFPAAPPELQGAPGPSCPLHSIAGKSSGRIQGPSVHRLAAFQCELDRCEAGMSYPIANRMKLRQSDPETGGSAKLYQASNAAPVVQVAARRLEPGSSESGAGRKPASTALQWFHVARQSGLDATAPKRDAK